MSDTPRTDATAHFPVRYFDSVEYVDIVAVSKQFAETLERELSAAARGLERCSEQFDASERALEATTRKLEEAECEIEAQRWLPMETVRTIDSLKQKLAEVERRIGALKQELEIDNAIAVNQISARAEQHAESEALIAQLQQQLAEAQRTNSAIALETVTLAATITEARKDAERYRFLTNFEDWSRSGFSWHAIISKECLDEYIDVGLGLAFK